jgi:putative nucleotidyltransferase with HDIG domain
MLCVVMSLSEGKRVLSIWRERFAWLWPHYVVFGALAGGIVLTEQAIGLYTLLVFGFPVISLLVAEKQYVERSRASVTELRRSHDELEHTNKRLRALLASHEELLRRMHRSYLSTITSLARTIEAKDPYTGGHTERVARVATLLAAELGMEGKELEAVEVGGIIHDIGKIGIPDSILLKPGRLSDAEFSEMRRHPEMSSYIVAELELPQTVKQMARSHHERYDGTGYPDGLAGTDIPLAARILTVADTLDAMTSDRPYRAALALADAIDEIERNAGRQFCPEVVAALRACLARDRTLGGQYVEGPTEATERAVTPEQDMRQAV